MQQVCRNFQKKNPNNFERRIIKLKQKLKIQHSKKKSRFIQLRHLCKNMFKNQLQLKPKLKKTFHQVIGSEDVLGGSRNSRIQLSRFFTDEDSDKQCRNCRKLGHTARNCGEPPKMPPCYGCASRGHMYRDCPHKPNVGKPRWNVECGRCRRRGHMTSQCPDAWRQFRFSDVIISVLFDYCIIEIFFFIY